MGDLGVAGTIQTKFFNNTHALNRWLDEENPDAEVIDIKFATTERFPECLLLIYRKENS